MSDVQTGYLETNGARIYYEVAGTGQPVLMVHAGVADCTMWDDQFAAFQGSYRVIRHDTRGFGKTKTENVSFSNRQDIVDLLDHLGVEKAAVIGCSRGGQIVIDFTVEHPERVAALIPVAAGMSGFDFESLSIPASESEVFEELEKLYDAKDMQGLVDLETYVWVDGPQSETGRADARVRERVHAMIAANYAEHANEEPQPQVLEPPAAGRLREIQVPTLVIVGNLDTFGTVAMADYMEQHIVGAQKVVFDQCAHMLNMEEPERFNRVVLDFLGRALA